jgi:hypothetical protein
MSTLRIRFALAAALVLAACGGNEAGIDTGERPPSRTEQRPDEIDDSPPAAGVEAPGEVACVNGWVVPDDREQRELPFHVIRRTQKVDGEFDVVEMRYFEGPESPPSDKGYLLTVDRWYVKAEHREDPSFRGRWLIEERAFGSGVVAVAPFDSAGFESPHWIGFQQEVDVDDQLRRYPELDLPGRWAGQPYDFVTGRDLETGRPVFNFVGLPPEVAGCLEGT